MKQKTTRYPKVDYHDGIAIVTFLDFRILDSLAISQMSEFLFWLVDGNDQDKMLLNFSEVRYLSSEALGKFLALKHKLLAKKGKLVICCLVEEIWEPLRIAHFDDHIKIVATQEEGLKEFTNLIIP